MLPWAYLYDHLSQTMFLSAFVIGTASSACLVSLGQRQSTSRLRDYYLGTVENPQSRVRGRVLDAKVYLYLVGAVHLELNPLSCVAAAHRVVVYHQSADTNKGGVALAAALLRCPSWSSENETATSGAGRNTVPFGVNTAKGCLAGSRSCLSCTEERGLGSGATAPPTTSTVRSCSCQLSSSWHFRSVIVCSVHPD